MNKLAKALYDNTAECADELAFRKGDIVVVLDQHIAGTSGWWMCSLYGRHGLAPANRLQLLPETGGGPAAEKPEERVQNIYQIPSVPRPSGSPAYERMDRIYKVPSARSPALSAEGDKASLCSATPGPRGEVYDVPSQARRASLFTTSTTPRHSPRKYSLLPDSELEKRFDSPESLRCSSPGDAYVYAVPPPLSQDPNYDIPVPSAAEAQQKTVGGYSTLPNPRKPEWIYDVPVGPEKPSPPKGSYDTVPHKAACRQLCFPARAWPPEGGSPTSSLYDIPKPSSLDVAGSPRALPAAPIYDRPPTQTASQQPPEEPVTRVPSDSTGHHIPLECRGDPGRARELNRACRQRVRDFLASTTFHEPPGGGEAQGPEGGGRSRPAESQRISTASSSSTSSCDSLALSSSSPEPLREVTLSQDEVSRRLLDLQESVCRAVPRLMEFVSSNWRSREHLQEHLQEIREAAEGVACSLTCFLNFALDIKGNARRLTDANLQTRLSKQLSIIDDSGVILQQTVSALSAAGWPLDKLCQEPGHSQTPDQLERFVMVARTIPEDVKRLVSITIANGKLLFRAPQKEPEPEPKTRPSSEERGGDPAEDDSDYVELQTKNEFEKQQKTMQSEPRESVTTTSDKAQAENKRSSSESGGGPGERRSPAQSEHCRLYFGALQKAIGGFVASLQDGQPPERFISQSKLVIMVGQRLVDTLCREAQRGASSQSLLCRSNHLCALLKQLAVATKKAALHFPDQQALREAEEFAKELAQRARHFRVSLDL